MDFDERMVALRERFLERCRSDAVLVGDHLMHESEDVLAVVHRLSGTAGMFGFEALSAAAEQAESMLREEEEAGAALALVLSELRKLQAD